MTAETRPQVIAIEEHFWDPVLAEHFDGADSMPARMRDRLEDMGEMRLGEMDEAGIDIQVLSQGAPSTQRLEGETAITLARGVNDRLRQAIDTHPDRYAGFAALPTAEPKAAADELERAVTELGFKGAMVHGLTNGLFLDDKRFWPIFERAQALGVPLYIHPATPHEAIVETYYKDYVKSFPNLLSAGWGFTVEIATQGIRLVLSGVFDAYPDVQVILGHLGEGLPFSLWRIDQALSRPGNQATSFRDTFCEHIHITTSGNFSNPALLCCVMEMGVDRILFSVDWPFVKNSLGTDWMKDVPLCAEDKAKILSGNAKKLLDM